VKKFEHEFEERVKKFEHVVLSIQEKLNGDQVGVGKKKLLKKENKV
jgi:hypothetical protein